FLRSRSKNATQLEKNAQVSFRTNYELLEQAQNISKNYNFNMTDVYNALLQKIVESKEIPVELMMTAEDKDKIIDELFGEINKGYQSFLNGNQGKSVDEVFSKYGL
ncbi:MAG: type II toxin-antitoxin system RelB/DinJ family antitoxin, partial [Streptococcaceae bacterium]|nr:type II toxin-antitoxin system RelB/DinJ family antitoxin [Streptococcaceae bacterium]